MFSATPTPHMAVHAHRRALVHARAVVADVAVDLDLDVGVDADGDGVLARPDCMIRQRSGGRRELVQPAVELAQLDLVEIDGLDATRDCRHRLCPAGRATSSRRQL